MNTMYKNRREGMKVNAKVIRWSMNDAYWARGLLAVTTSWYRNGLAVTTSWYRNG